MTKQTHLGPLSPLAPTLLRQMDSARQNYGKILDAAGLGPIETPHRVVDEQDGVRLRAYGDAAPGSPVFFIVPAPIKRHYIWDLAPHVSVVRDSLERGMRVYLAEWIAERGKEGPDPDWGLADYADRMLSSCIDAIAIDAGLESGHEQILMAGHSLGGTLAAIHACRYPQRLAKLALLEAPIHFGGVSPGFRQIVSAALDASEIAELFGDIPGSFLNITSSVAAPREFQWQRLLDLVVSTGNYQALMTHLRVERWALDEFPMSGKLFTEIIELLYRRDQLMQGTLLINGKRVGPRDLTVPLLTVFDPRSSVIPPESVVPFHETAASKSKKLLYYQGDIGVAIQHVGILVGVNAHANVWPLIFNWLEDLEPDRPADP